MSLLIIFGQTSMQEILVNHVEVGTIYEVGSSFEVILNFELGTSLRVGTNLEVRMHF